MSRERHTPEQIIGKLRESVSLANGKTVRISAVHGAASHRGLAREPQVGRTHLATGGAEGAGKATKTRPNVAQRRPSWPNHVWAYDFVMAHTHEGRTIRMLTIIDEYTRE